MLAMMKTASRPRSIVTAMIIAGAAIVAGCRAETAPPPSRSPDQRSAQPTGTTARSIGDLTGEWRIVSIDGQKVRPPAANLDKRPASISFAPPFYGGSAGCNSLGGIGVIDGGHYFTAPGPQTLIGCPPDLMKLETAWNQTMRANPAILSTGRGSWQLRGGGHMLDLADRRPSVIRPMPILESLAGTGWNLLEVDGHRLGYEPHATRKLSFSRGVWCATDGCRTAHARFRQTAGRIVPASAELAQAAGRCKSDAAHIGTIARLMAAPAHYVTGPNGEFLMAGSGHWLVASRDGPPAGK
jgi:heat shock protein HslJ